MNNKNIDSQSESCFNELENLKRQASAHLETNAQYCPLVWMLI